MLKLTLSPHGRDDAVYLTLPDGREIRVCVLEMARGRVMLGFAAPKDVIVRRRIVRQLTRTAEGSE